MIKRYDPMVLISPLLFQGFSLLVLRENIPGGGGVRPYMGYMGMCRCEGYGSVKQFTLG